MNDDRIDDLKMIFEMIRLVIRGMMLLVLFLVKFILFVFSILVYGWGQGVLEMYKGANWVVSIIDGIIDKIDDRINRIH